MFNPNGSAIVTFTSPKNIFGTVYVTVAGIKKNYVQLKHCVNSSMINLTVDLYRFPISVSAF